jgi:hypothetical protein
MLPEMPKKVVGNPSAGAKQSGLDLRDQWSSLKKALHNKLSLTWA